MKKYINIHSHSENSSSTTIVNCFPDEIETSLANMPHQYYSVGLHPWHIKSDYKKELETIVSFASNSQVLAIGETGLDKLCDTPFELQQKVFIQQAKIAESVQKPLIIHCVKAYSEIIQLQKELNPTTPWILHGYRGNKQITQQLLSHNFCFSLGKGVSILEESIKLIPLEKIFLETDDSDFPIDNTYTTIAQMLDIDVSLLVHALNINFEQVFLRKLI